MSLRYVREMSFHLLYQFEFQPEHITEQEAQFLSLAKQNELAMQEFYPLNWDEAEQKASADLALAVFAKKDELDALYAPHLIGWKISRLPKIDKVILRLACYELLERKEVPVSVVLNEAVELIKSYGEQKARAYVNAVLGKVVRENLQAIANLRGISPEQIKDTLSYQYADSQTDTTKK